MESDSSVNKKSIKINTIVNEDDEVYLLIHLHHFSSVGGFKNEFKNYKRKINRNFTYWK